MTCPDLARRLQQSGKKWLFFPGCLLATLLLVVAAFGDDPQSKSPHSQAEQKQRLLRLRSRAGIYLVKHGAPAYANHIRELPFPLGGVSADDRNMLVVDLFDPNYQQRDVIGGSLVRELGRQSLLLAGREELGLQTRDRALREENRVPANPVAWPFTVITQLTERGQVQVGVLQLTDKEWKVHSEKTFNVKLETLYQDLATTLEGYSRTEYPIALRKAGFHDAVRKPGSRDAAILSAVEKELGTLNEFSQWHAVRELHREIQKAGETPELMGALVRGYAHLGALTQHYWSAASKVFMARTLLYAERMVARSQGSAAALRHRAYARALIGLYQPALDDLDAAAKSAGESNQPPVPDWEPVIRAYASADESTLRRHTEEGSQRSLAMLATMLTCELTQDHVQTAAFCRRLLDFSPACFRALIMLERDGEGENYQFAKAQRDYRLRQTIYPMIKSLADLPAELRKQLEKAEFGETLTDEQTGADWKMRYQLIRGLQDYGKSQQDHGEPSLATLAYLLQETSFLINRPRATITHQQHLALEALLEGHPFKDLSGEMIYDDLQQNEAALHRLASRLDAAELEWPCDPAIKYTRYRDSPRRTILNNVLYWHSDAIPRDLWAWLPRMSENPGKDVRDALAQLRRIAPRALFTVIETIRHDQQESNPRLREWERKYRGSVPVLREIAESYQESQRLQDAERVYERCLELEQNFDNFRRIAEVYLEMGETSRWVSMLDQALQFPAHEKKKSNARSAMAQYYFDRQDLQVAKRYALEAGDEPQAQWIAARVSEKLGEHAEAERYYQSLSQGYPDWQMAWYFYCLRSGRGNISEARKQADEYLKSLPNPPDSNALDQAMAVAVTGERSQQALGYARRAQTDFPDRWFAWNVVLLAQEQNDRALRDATLKKLIADLSADQNPLSAFKLEFAKLIQKDFDAPGPSHLDLPAVERLVNRFPDADLMIFWYVLGRYLDVRGHAVEARKYYEWCVGTPEPPRSVATSQVMAAKRLLDAGLKLPPSRLDRQIKLTISSREPGVQTLQEPQGPVFGVRFSGDGKSLAAGVHNGFIHIWDVSGDVARQRTKVGEDRQPMVNFQISPDGKQLAISLSNTSNLFLWDAMTGERQRPLIGHGVMPYRVAYSPDGKTLAVYYVSDRPKGSVRGDITPWDIETFREGRKIPIIGADLQLMQYLPDGKELIGCTVSKENRSVGRVQKWSIARRTAETLYQEFSAQHTRLAVSADGQRYLIRSSTGAIQLRDVAQAESLATTFQPFASDAIALSPDGQLVAFGMVDGTIRLWEAVANHERQPLRGHQRSISSLVFSPDGKRLASGSADMTVRLWDLSKFSSELSNSPPVGIATNSLGMKFIRIPEGSFSMGETLDHPEVIRRSAAVVWERPEHSVRISRTFELGQHEVTVGQFREFVKTTSYQTDGEKSGGVYDMPPGPQRKADRKWNWQSPGFKQAEDHPVVQVSWNDAVAFCEWLSRKEGVKYRLPTEAEWEYACRCGQPGVWSFGSELKNVPTCINFADSSLIEHFGSYSGAMWMSDGFPFTAPVGSFPPNAWGLYEMSGNAGEWCQDWYDRSYYRKSPAVDPQGPTNGRERVCRGGNFSFPPYDCRSASRSYDFPNAADANQGFRVLREIPEKAKSAK